MFSPFSDSFFLGLSVREGKHDIAELVVLFIFEGIDFTQPFYMSFF